MATTFYEQLASRLMGGYAGSSALSAEQHAEMLRRLEAAVGTPSAAGGAPDRTAYLSVRPGGVSTVRGGWGFREQIPQYSAPSYQYDREGYVTALTGWLRGQSRYKDWSDDDLRSFAASTADVPDAQRNAAAFWEESRRGWDQAATEARQDRDTMLADLETYRQGFNSQWMTQTLSREKAYWDARITQTLTRVQAQYAALGRVASPYLMGELSRRMTAQAADALQVRRLELENEQRRQMETYLSMKNQVYSNTQRNVMAPETVLSIMQALGTAAA